MNAANGSGADDSDARSIVLRQAETSEIAEIRALLAAAYLPVADANDSHVPCFLVAAETHGIIGTVAVEPCGGYGLLRSLAVRPEARGRGIGRRLVTECETRARQTGLRGLYLLTTTAERFFGTLGYDELERWELPESVRRTEAFRSLCPESAIAMMKRLL